MTFDEIFKKNTVWSAVDPARQSIIYEAVMHTQNLGAKMAEVGVYNGGSSFTIANADPNRRLYACDTFEGLPEVDASVDLHKKGDFGDADFETVKKYLNFPNVTVIKGLFPDPTIHDELYHETFSFVHLDVDLYKPTLDCLEFFYPRMVDGGVIITDDYGMSSCPGVKKAFTEFFKDKLEPVIDTQHFSAYITKSRFKLF